MGVYDRISTDASCSVANDDGGPCERRVRGRATPPYEGYWCEMHRGRWRNHGDPTGSTAMRRAGLASWFWAQVSPPTSSGCREWTMSISSQGYGSVYWDDRMEKAHRVAFALANDVPLPGLYVCHHCDNRQCCEPAHLYDGTPQTNASDAASRLRYANQRKTHCAKGHELVVVGPGTKRGCRICHLARANERRRAKRGASF